MSDYRIPGPIGTDGHAVPTDWGTCPVRLTPAPGPVASGGKMDAMALEDRFVSVLQRTAPKLPGEVREEFAAMLDPATLAVIVGVLALWAGSHYVGVGFIVDILLVVVGIGFLGWQIWSVGNDFIAFLDLTYTARTEDDLEKAATHLANFIAVVGVAAFMALVARGAKRYTPKARKLRGLARAASAADAGMPATHFRVFARVASDANRPRILLVRKTNPASVKWIERGFPAKPKEIKMKTGKVSGIVTCKDAGEVAKAKNTLRHGSGKQYFVVDDTGRTASNARAETIDLSNADWPVEPNQVIDPVAKKPLVGDYDLMGVIDPNAKGRNLALAVDNVANQRAGKEAGTLADDFSNTEITKVAREVNKGLDQPRVLHGSHEAFDSIDNLDAGETVVGFFPDGRAFAFDRTGLKEFYETIGRSTLDLKRFLPEH